MSRKFVVFEIVEENVPTSVVVFFLFIVFWFIFVVGPERSDKTPAPAPAPQPTTAQIERVKLEQAAERQKQAEVAITTAQQTQACIQVNDPKGSSLMDRGVCMAVGPTSGKFAIGAESPVLNISGADFIVMTNDETSRCDSKECDVKDWLQKNQTLGGEDARYHKPRYWLRYVAQGVINIQS
jgi:hypothetical protein